MRKGSIILLLAWNRKFNIMNGISCFTIIPWQKNNSRDNTETKKSSSARTHTWFTFFSKRFICFSSIFFSSESVQLLQLFSKTDFHGFFSLQPLFSEYCIFGFSFGSIKILATPLLHADQFCFIKRISWKEVTMRSILLTSEQQYQKNQVYSGWYSDTEHWLLRIRMRKKSSTPESANTNTSPVISVESSTISKSTDIQTISLSTNQKRSESNSKRRKWQQRAHNKYPRTIRAIQDHTYNSHPTPHHDPLVESTSHCPDAQWYEYGRSHNLRRVITGVVHTNSPYHRWHVSRYFRGVHYHARSIW